MDCDTAGYKQARYDEIANETKSEEMRYDFTRARRELIRRMLENLRKTEIDKATEIDLAGELEGSARGSREPPNKESPRRGADETMEDDGCRRLVQDWQQGELRSEERPRDDKHEVEEAPGEETKARVEEGATYRRQDGE